MRVIAATEDACTHVWQLAQDEILSLAVFGVSDGMISFEGRQRCEMLGSGPPKVARVVPRVVFVDLHFLMRGQVDVDCVAAYGVVAPLKQGPGFVVVLHDVLLHPLTPKPLCDKISFDLVEPLGM